MDRKTERKCSNLPVTRVVNGRGDAVGVVGGEAEAVVLLEILIGSHAERDREGRNAGDNYNTTSHLCIEPLH